VAEGIEHVFVGENAVGKRKLVAQFGDSF